MSAITILTLSQTTNFRLFQPEKQFVDDNFKLVENCRKISKQVENTVENTGRKHCRKQVENTVGKGEIARYEQFLLFPQCFEKTCTADT